jgi:DNA-binding transcriptional ArsR family regulator
MQMSVRWRVSKSIVDDYGVRLMDPGKVAVARSGLPPEATINECAQVFALLGEPGRLRLLASLLHAGELCVGDLAATTGMTESAVSHALRLLRAYRVVTVSRRGRMAYYRLDDAHVQTLLALGLTHTAHTGTVRDLVAPAAPARRSSNRGRGRRT